MGTTALWAKERADLVRVSAGTTDDRAAAVQQYTAAITDLIELLTQVGNGSNLILDPQLASYYVMDTWLNRVPAAVDAATAATSLISLDAAGHTPTEFVPQLAVETGSLAANLAAERGNLDIATHSAGRSSALLLRGRASFESAAAAVIAPLQARLAGKRADPTVLPLIAAARSAQTPLADSLTGLLHERIAGLQRREQLALIETAVALLLAGWFAVGVAIRVRVQMQAVSASLTALESGDLTVTTQLYGRDEISAMAQSLDRARAGISQTISGVSEQASSVAVAALTLADVASSVEGNRGSLAAGTEQMTMAIEEIAPRPSKNSQPPPARWPARSVEQSVEAMTAGSSTKPIVPSAQSNRPSGPRTSSPSWASPSPISWAGSRVSRPPPDSPRQRTRACND